MTPWPTLERMPGLYAVTADWRAGMGEALEPFSTFFRLFPRTAGFFPCPRHCGCAHTVFHCDDGTILARCRCKPWRCHHLKLSPEDINLWELNQPKLARAITKALGLTSKYEEIGPPSTAQIGTWSADAVPAFLTIQWDEREFRLVVASLVARQQSPFILLAPTATHMDATSQSYLANAGAEFFSLETHLTLTPHGTFQPTKLPGEIFSRFRPEPTDDEEMLRNAILLVKATDAEQGRRKVTLYSVMRLYCFDCLNPIQITRKCRCARSITFARLAELRQKLGRDPAEFRQYASQFESLKSSLSDPKAKCIYRKGAIYGDEDHDQ